MTSAFPLYLCHKQVRAVKIRAIEQAGYPGAALIHADESGIAPFRVDLNFIHKHAPQPGGYIVVYDDGYMSYSPAAAFESGYTRVP